MSNQTTGGMPANLQIKYAAEEGMANIARAIFGENLRWEVKYNLSQITENGLGMAHARATAVGSLG